MQSELEIVIDAIREEFRRAKHKHPGENPSAHHGFAVLQEEVEEAWDDVKRNDLVGAKKEMIQVAAMAVRFILEAK